MLIALMHVMFLNIKTQAGIFQGHFLMLTRAPSYSFTGLRRWLWSKRYVAMVTRAVWQESGECRDPLGWQESGTSGPRCGTAAAILSESEECQ